MRRILVLLLVPLLVGCLGQPDRADDADATLSAAPPDSPSPSPSAAPAADPSPTPEATAPAAPEPAPGPAPEPVAWRLVRSERLGWLVGLGVGSSGPGNVGHGHTDAEHCPDASVVVPEGAERLAIHVFDANETGGGFYDVQVAAPDGTVTHHDVFLGAVPGGTSPSPLEFADPAAGEWGLHVEPSGPVVGRVYALHVEVAGASVVVPAELAGGPAC